MPKVFEMSRRAKQPIRCDVCREIIEIGQRWCFRRAKTKYGWREANICEECYVFGPPSYSVYDILPPLLPNSDIS